MTVVIWNDGILDIVSIWVEPSIISNYKI